MIRSVLIRNFESHRKTKLLLSPGVTSIVGDSEHGKSAIIRAVMWLVFNRPTGAEYRSKWGGATSVTVTFNDGHKVTRVKGAGKNEYRITRPDGKVSVFSGFKQDVPERVTQLLRMNQLNFQTQHAPHYLLPPTSPGEVARRMNEVVNLKIIDDTQASINAMLRDNQRALQETEASMEGLRQKKRELSWVRQARESFSELSTLSGRLERVRDEEQRLHKILWEINQLGKESAATIDSKKAGREILALNELGKRMEDLKSKRLQIANLLKEIVSLKANIQASEAELKREEDRFHRSFPERCPLCGSVSGRKRQLPS